jgi:hypothetical protein
MSDATDETVTVKPLGDCPICGTDRAKQKGNADQTVQECPECGSRWERRDGMVFPYYDLVKCPPDPDRPVVRHKRNKWERIDESEDNLEDSSTFPPGMDLDGPLLTVQNIVIPFIYLTTWPISIPYLVYKYWQEQSDNA